MPLVHLQSNHDRNQLAICESLKFALIFFACDLSNKLGRVSDEAIMKH